MSRIPKKNGILLVAALALVGTLVAYAGIIGLNAMDVSVSAVWPPLVFEDGTNANQNGIQGTTITVTYEQGKTLVTVEFSISNGTVYVYDPVRIKNNDTAATIYFKPSVVDTAPLQQYFNISILYFVDSTGNTVAYLDLQSNTLYDSGGNTIDSVAINQGDSYKLVFKLVPNTQQWKAGTANGPTNVQFNVEFWWSTNAADLTVPLP